MKILLAFLLVMNSSIAFSAKNKKNPPKSKVQTKSSPKKVDTKEEQVKFVTDFYKKYLNHQLGSAAARSRFFSKPALEALSKNTEECNNKVREGSCGFASENDLYLNVPEFLKEQNFDNSQFSAVVSGSKQVDVSFKALPAPETLKEIRLFLVQEKKNWRVDDLIYKDEETKKFKPGQSMRKQIEREIKLITKNAKDLKTFWLEVSSFLESGTHDLIVEYIKFPVEICEKAGPCSKYNKTSKVYENAFYRVRDHYKKFEYESKFVKPPTNPKEGESYSSGPLGLKFKKGAWWIEKIDLAKVQST